MSIGRPISPAAIRALAALNSGSKRRMKPICSATFAFSARGDHVVALGEAKRHWLLDEDVLAGLRRSDGEVPVREGRRRDHDGIELPPVEGGVGVGEGAIDAEVGDRLVAGLGDALNHRREPRAGHVSRHGIGVDPSGASSADEADADRGFR